MSGKLSKSEKNYLQAWINKGPKKFELLDSFTKDGCNGSVFHQKCDNQGPTVTVLYNTEGSVYGGYTNVNWDSSSGYKTDKDAFLFTLKFSGKLSKKQFPLKAGHEGHAIYCHNSYGPIFGGGHDIDAFSGSISPQNGVYTLNGGANLNNSYDTQGLTADKVTNGIQTMTELEVYKVIDGKDEMCIEEDIPWRIVDASWDDEHLASLMEEICSFSPPPGLPIKQSNILVLGPVGAGKSSFINTIASVFHGKISHLAISGSAEESITSKYRMYAVRNRRNVKPLNFRLCDTRGLEETNGIDTLEMSYILAGNVPNGYQFHPSVTISPDSPGFKKNPSLSDCIHCVVLVVDGTTIDVIPEKMLERIKSLQKVANTKGVRLFVVLTKIDKVCATLEHDLQSAFKSSSIRDLVDKASQMFGVPRQCVLPAKNYEQEVALQDDVSTLALLNLRQILLASEDFMYNIMDEHPELCKGSESVD